MSAIGCDSFLPSSFSWHRRQLSFNGKAFLRYCRQLSDVPKLPLSYRKATVTAGRKLNKSNFLRVVTVVSQYHRQIITMEVLCLQLPSTACDFLRLPSTASDCLQLPATACTCLRLPATAFNCLRLPSTAFNCLRLPSTAFNCLRLPVTAFDCRQHS